MNKFICIHGHFYQPPRENAWLEVIELQDSAHPFHDWNERITAECYAPNTASRILDDRGIIRDIVSNYSKINFNFGPTLLSWMETTDPETYESILEADKASIARFGHGSAMAQVYNHMIMPLASERDKETQIIWGIRDFEYRYSRFPDGMWLAETAVDTATLELLAANGIKYTVLAPRQAKAFRKIGEDRWRGVEGEGIDTRRAYQISLPSGKSIAVFFYNGQISQAVAFNGLLYDGQKFAQALIDGFDTGSDEPQLVNIATDGETYGHHHKRGDMALAYCLDYIERKQEYTLTNYAEFLIKFPPTYEAQIHEDSSWSCVHGVERWRNDCGCNSGGNPGWTQRWRKPLREAFDWLRDQLVKVYDDHASPILKDPVAARNDYITVILRRSDDTIRRFLAEHCSKDVEQNTVFRLMEMERHALLMYTSCGWFFDEISGIETTQIMQYACRGIQLAYQIDGIDLEPEFIDRLGKAPSNISALVDGANIYNRHVLPSKTNIERVGMHYAVASIFEENPEKLPVFNYTTTNEYFVKKEAGEQNLAIGKARIRSNTTRTEKLITFCVLYLGKHNLIGNLSLDMDDDTFDKMNHELIDMFDEARIGDVIGTMQNYFGPERYTIWQLFSDEKRKVLDLITRQSMMELEDSLRRVYQRDYPLVTALANNGIPIPGAYRTTFEYILNADLLNCFQAHKINISEFVRVMNGLARWNLKIEDPGKVGRLVGESIFMELKRVRAEKSNVKRIERLNRLFPLLRTFNLSSDLYKTQNLYFEIATEINKTTQKPDWVKQFKLLGENLGVKVKYTLEKGS